jgi:hypothetical protein
MRERLRLRFVLPLVVVAAAGLGVLRFDLLERVGLVAEEGEPVAASASGAPDGTGDSEPAPPAEEPAVEPSDTDTVEPAPAELEDPLESGGIDALAAALAERKVVVLVVYTPGAPLDELITREARLGAADVNAGFVTVNGAKENMIGELALTYDLRDTPAVLVFRRNPEQPELRTMLVGYADRQTVAQAALDARRKA